MKKEAASTSPATSAKRERRTIRKIERWTPTEAARVKANAEAANVEWSEWIRAAALKRAAKPKTQAHGHQLDMVQIMAELNKVGSNINQIAKRLNAGNPVEQPAVNGALQAVAQLADALRDQIERLSDDC
jgi:uncharacterized protein involved in exopolysaccharide biosynthesis